MSQIGDLIMPFKDPEAEKTYQREWAKKRRQDPEYNRRRAEQKRLQRQGNLEAFRKRERESRWKHRDKRNAYLKKYRAERKLETLRHYSGDPPKCECCGEDRIEFLSIDHINGGGTEHRKSLGTRGNVFYLWLRRQGYPTGYRVLCYNCHLSIGFLGYCPHEREEIVVEPDF